eukprot:jgi/Hompol1/102/HPOL_004118-RA
MSSRATHRQSSKKKSAKKQNQKRAPAKNSKDRGNDDEEDLDAVLSELNAKYGDIGLSSDASERITQSAEQQDKQLAAKQLFAIETRKLDGDAEMRNMFGRIATEETRNKRYVKTKRRTVLATARENWPPLARLGLSMELVQSQEDIRQFAFVHSQEYVQIQGMFFECVNSHDPQTIANLLHIYPYHIDSLLQLSEACKHNGDIAMASELIERALFSFERAFHPLFNVATGCCRLSYDRIENRALFLCIRRHIEYLTRRGCWQTAFEFQKLLISLDPITDPMCSELSLDFLALKAGGAALHWYKTFWEIQQGELQVLPNAAYSIALIEWELETQQSKPHDRSSELLRQAIAQFPGVVVALCDKMTMMHAISNNPALFSRDVNAPESVLEILIDFYVERAHTIWKVPETLQWFLSQVSIVSQDSQTQPQPDYVSAGKQFAMENYALEEPIPLNLQRAMFLSGQLSFVAGILKKHLDTRLLMIYPPPPPSPISLCRSTATLQPCNLCFTDNHLFISRLPKTTVQSGILAYDPIPPESSLPSVYDKMRPQPRLSASGDPLHNMLQWLGQFDFGIGDLARRVAAEVERRQRGEPHPENEPVDEEAVQEADRLDRVMNGSVKKSSERRRVKLKITPSSSTARYASVKTRVMAARITGSTVSGKSRSTSANVLDRDEDLLEVLAFFLDRGVSSTSSTCISADDAP